MPVEIESNYKGQAWQGKTGLKATRTEIAKTLEVKGNWLGQESNQTIFRILKPNQKLLQQFDYFSDYFLDANPNFPNAAIVENNVKAIKPKVDLKIGNKARVTCLDGIVAWENIKDKKEIFVDRLRVSTNNYEFVYPWAIEGMSDQEGRLKLSRSHESSEAKGSNSADIVKLALMQSTNEEIWSKLIKAAQSSNRLPMELRSWESDYFLNEVPEDLREIGNETKKVIKKLWESINGNDVYISRNQKEINRVAKEKNVKVILIYSGVMYSWLEASGVTTLEAQTGIIDSESRGRFDKMISVEYLDDEKYFAKFLLEITEQGGFIELIETADKQKIIKISFPYIITDREDKEDPSKTGYHLARKAAIIAKEKGLKIDVLCLQGDIMGLLTN